MAFNQHGPANFEELTRRATNAFLTRFGREPALVAGAPGRVNLLGEHVDYVGGLVLPIAIDRWSMCALAPSAGSESVLRAEDLDREHRFDLHNLHPVPAESPDRFANHVLGVLDALASNIADTSNRQWEMLVTGNVPMGAGLSSSAAVEVSVARALDGVLGLALDDRAVAAAAQDAEHAYVGTPCGIMDMLISAAAIEDHALLIDCRSQHTTPVPLPPSDRMVVLVVDTGVKHELASGAYADRRAACQRVEDRIGGPLRDADPADLNTAQLDDTDRKRAMHVIGENRRVLAAVDALQAGDLKRFGTLLLAGHASLRDLFEVSCPELDLIVEVVAGLGDQRIPGARMTGGGFGGSAIVILQPDAVGETQQHITRAFKARFGRDPGFFTVRAVGGARVAG